MRDIISFSIQGKRVKMKKIKIFAEVLEEEALNQFNKAMELDCNVQGALMPDTHTGYTLPIGAVIKSKGVVFPSYVGYDIGCGMCAIKLNINHTLIDFSRLKEHILSSIPLGFNKHNKPKEVKLNTSEVSEIVLEFLKEVGEHQLGTLGGGNHFIEVGRSEKDGSAWIVIHSGSRGLGHKVASYYMEEAFSVSKDSVFDKREYERNFYKRNKNFLENNPDGFKRALGKFLEEKEKAFLKQPINKEEHYGLEVSSEIGKQYLIDMNFCLEYALLNRKEMINRIVEGIEKQVPCKVVQFINRNHNHAEVKGEFIIHRKGATQAEKGMLGVVPGNMRDGSFIVKGKGNREAIESSSHGAGRVLSRIQARKTLDVEVFRKEMCKITTNHTDNMIDESPLAYKNIFEVMELQKDLVEVIDREIPLLNIKG